jgi:hypothetical protein
MVTTPPYYLRKYPPGRHWKSHIAIGDDQENSFSQVVCIPLHLLAQSHIIFWLKNTSATVTLETSPPPLLVVSRVQAVSRQFTGRGVSPSLFSIVQRFLGNLWLRGVLHGGGLTNGVVKPIR